MNIIIPIAGKDPQFEDAGVYKPLIEICNRPLIEYCTDKINRFLPRNNIIFILLDEHDRKYGVSEKINAIYRKKVSIIRLDSMTSGAAETVLQAKDIINNDEDLLIYLGDIYFDSDLESAMQKCKNEKYDGFIPCFPSADQKYSYAVVTGETITRVAEKEVISNNASAGMYYFSKGRYFVEAAEEMIAKNIRVNNQFYICPVYNQMIKKGMRILKVDANYRFGLGYIYEIAAFRNSMSFSSQKYRHLIFAHRGIETPRSRGNSINALVNAISNGFSVELDIRKTSDGKVVVFHDQKAFADSVEKTEYGRLASISVALFEDFLKIFRKYSDMRASIAIHVKNYDDELAEGAVNLILKNTLSSRCFFFDITAEEAREIKNIHGSMLTGASIVDDSIKAGHPNYYAESDLERIKDAFDVLWLDEWKNLYTGRFLKIARQYGKRMVAISPELHRNDGNTKDLIRAWELLADNGIYEICTDYPMELNSLLVVRNENKSNSF